MQLLFFVSHNSPCKIKDGAGDGAGMGLELNT